MISKKFVTGVNFSVDSPRRRLLFYMPTAKVVFNERGNTMKVKLSPARAKKYKYLDQCRALRRKGLSYREIASMFGVTATCVWHWCRDVRKGNIYDLKDLEVEEMDDEDAEE